MQKGNSVAAASGDTVKIHYTGTLSDGSVFDSSANREPIEFAIGSQSVIPGFESAVLGMNPGDSKKVTIPSAEAYGEHDPRMVQEVPRAELPPEMQLELGMRLAARGENGQEIPLVVTALNDETVRLDANHPLAGQDLTFEITLVSVA
ncbi:MAG: peptidylprolyl isomerase [Rhizobiales bacterium]|nr:peptidylprolyl isomerase [Hyphomicrobiales bacterium]